MTSQDKILNLVEQGLEHEARDRYGDTAVDDAIRADLEADGYDFDTVLAHANGYGR